MASARMKRVTALVVFLVVAAAVWLALRPGNPAPEPERAPPPAPRWVRAAPPPEADVPPAVIVGALLLKRLGASERANRADAEAER